MEEQHCSDCQYNLQHYALGRKKIFRVYCGHCTFNRAKQKHPDTKACKDFVVGISREEAFASKEYLSKELLRYVLSLELLPEIKDRERND